MSVIDTEVVIVGAGPIGLELAVALKHAGAAYEHLEAGQVGATIQWYPRQARFFSSPERIAIAGVPLVTTDQTKATREEYLAYLRSVVTQHDLPIRTYCPVLRVQPIDGRACSSGDGAELPGGVDPASARFVIHTPHETFTCRSLVLAIGDMHAPRRLGIPGEDLPHVSHYFKEPHEFFRRRLLIVGGANSAAEAALRCHLAGAQVTISYRRAAFREGIKYWLRPELESLIEHDQITFHPMTEPVRIGPRKVTLRRVTDAPRDEAPEPDPDHPDPIQVPADAVLLLTGYTQDKTLLQQAGVELSGENRAPVYNPDTMQTHVPGLFIAGTAAAGTQQSFRLFIENCHNHAAKIAQQLTGDAPPTHLINDAAQTYDLPES